MRGGRSILLALGAALGFSLSACAGSGSYYGIDVASMAAEASLDPARQRAVRERNLVMVIAMLRGCYVREDGGFGPVRAARASSFECAEILADVEHRSAALGLGRAPGGIWALDLATLAQQAQAGDKHAQVELGIRFEEGIGVTQSKSNACSLYRKAATSSGGTIWVYSPPVGNGTTGQVIPIDRGPVIAGLPEASERLEALEARSGC